MCTSPRVSTEMQVDGFSFDGQKTAQRDLQTEKR